MSTQSACKFTDRLNKAKDLKEAVIYYLKNEKQQPGLPRPQQRNVLKKVKSYEWDQNSGHLYAKGKGPSRHKCLTTIEEIKEVLQQYHQDAVGGQSGINNTYRKVNLYYTWPGSFNDVKDYVLSCSKCQLQDKIKTQAPSLQPITVSEPLELVGMDLLVGNKDDDPDREVVLTQDAQKFAEQMGIQLYETSAKENKNVEEMFVAITKLVLATKKETQKKVVEQPSDGIKSNKCC